MKSATYFESDLTNFVVYEVTTGKRAITYENIGLIYTSDNTNFLDISYASSKGLKDIDRVLFTEIITSLKKREKLLPFSNKITKEIDIKL